MSLTQIEDPLFIKACQQANLGQRTASQPRNCGGKGCNAAQAGGLVFKGCGMGTRRVTVQVRRLVYTVYSHGGTSPSATSVSPQLHSNFSGQMDSYRTLSASVRNSTK